MLLRLSPSLHKQVFAYSVPLSLFLLSSLFFSSSNRLQSIRTICITKVSQESNTINRCPRKRQASQGPVASSQISRIYCTSRIQISQSFSDNLRLAKQTSHSLTSNWHLINHAFLQQTAQQLNQQIYLGKRPVGQRSRQSRRHGRFSKLRPELRLEVSRPEGLCGGSGYSASV